MNDPFSLYGNERYSTIRHIPHLSFPLMLIMQASSYCNFNCRQCPRVVKVPRRQITGLGNGFMEPALVRKAAEQFKDQPAFLGTLFALYGEPLMNPHIVHMVEIVKAAGKKVQITTNALLLSEEMSRQLIDAGLDKIKFSFQGTTENAYSFWRNTPHYHRVLENIFGFLELREKRGANVFVQVGTSVAEDSDEEIGAFLSFWKDKVDDVYYDATGMLHLLDQDYIKAKGVSTYGRAAHRAVLRHFFPNVGSLQRPGALFAWMTRNIAWEASTINPLARSGTVRIFGITDAGL